VAVGLALVEQARDGLLPDVAALGEADRSLVEARLLGDDGVVQVDAVARAAALDAQHVRGRLVDLHRAGVHERVAHALGVVAVAHHVEPDVGTNQQHLGAADDARRVVVLVRADRSRHRLGVRPDQAEQATLERALVQLAVEADLETADRVEERLQRAALAEQQQFGGGRAELQHAQVGEHLALVGEQRGVAAVPGLERLDLVGDLAVEERLGLAAGQRELAALRAVDEGHAPGHRGVGVHRATS